MLEWANSLGTMAVLVILLIWVLLQVRNKRNHKNNPGNAITLQEIQKGLEVLDTQLGDYIKTGERHMAAEEQWQKEVLRTLQRIENK